MTKLKVRGLKWKILKVKGSILHFCQKKNHCITNVVCRFLELNLHASTGSVLELGKYAGAALIVVLRPQVLFFCDLFFYPIWISKYWWFGLVFWTCSSSPAIAITRPQPKSPMHQAPTPQFSQVRCSNLIGVLLISTVYNSWVFD